MQKLLWIGVAGAAGALARYLLAGLAQRWGGSSFPWGTLAVNLLGSLLFGTIWALAEDRLLISAETRLILLTGFMGAFTTFSTFMYESSTLISDGEWTLATLNLFGSLAAGITCMFIGLAIGRQF